MKFFQLSPSLEIHFYCWSMWDDNDDEKHKHFEYKNIQSQELNVLVQWLTNQRNFLDLYLYILPTQVKSNFILIPNRDLCDITRRSLVTLNYLNWNSS